jgi:hypothetical protein
MARLWKSIAPMVAVALSFGIAYASGAIGVYALIDKVVLEPNAAHPERIQIWGVFSIADNPNSIQAPQRGYVYYALPSGETEARETRMRNEWNDLKNAAGTHQVVGFGSSPPRVRLPDQRHANPDRYTFSFGAGLLRSDTDFPPIKALLEFR